MTFNLENIKSQLKKFELDNFDSIELFEKINLASMGSNDTEGFQVFTPEFIVKDMVKAIGNDEVFDITKNILEPTSGDGAFTVYIASKRLENILKNDPEKFEINSLIALSTIYSIEMDEELIKKQRNNIFTLYKTFADKNGIQLSHEYFELVKCIISTNFMWAMFNSDGDLGLMSADIAFKMPEAEKKNEKVLDMVVWKISNDNVEFDREGVDLW